MTSGLYFNKNIQLEFQTDKILSVLYYKKCFDATVKVGWTTNLSSMYTFHQHQTHTKTTIDTFVSMHVAL